MKGWFDVRRGNQGTVALRSSDGLPEEEDPKMHECVPLGQILGAKGRKHHNDEYVEHQEEDNDEWEGAIEKIR